jgi:hypothetical protein
MPGHCLLWAVVISFLYGSSIQAEEIPNREGIEFSALMPADKALQQIALVREALRSGSCIKLAEFVRFPFIINQPGRESRSIWNRTAFCRYYSSVFDKDRTNAFLEQDIAETPIGYRGLSFWKSGVWLQPTCPGTAPQADCHPSMYQLKLVSVTL